MDKKSKRHLVGEPTRRGDRKRKKSGPPNKFTRQSGKKIDNVQSSRKHLTPSSSGTSAKLSNEGNLSIGKKSTTATESHLGFSIMNSHPPMHDALKSLAWLEGEWRAEDGQGEYPTIKKFRYCEVLKFVSIGQPMLNYEAQSWHPEKKSPMHREVGFLKVNPGTEKVALVLAHNFGLATVEEGVVRDNEIKLESTSISRISTGTKEPAVTKLRRELRLVDDRLEQIIYMATSTTPEITEHLRARYVKQPSQ